MKRQFKILTILLVVPTLMLAAANPKFKGKHTKEKKINKEYTVSADATVEIDNSYGNVDIVTWNENRVVIEVLIRTNGNNEEKVMSRLNDIDVEFEASNSRVSAKTIFKGKKNNSWSFWGKNKNNHVKMEINYSVKMPVRNSVELDNSYGAISLNELNGNASIDCDYGQLNIGDLNGDQNSLNFDYTNNSTIGYMKNGSINADYSNFTLERTGDLDINADYTNSEILQAVDVTYNCDYGKLKIGSVNSVNGRGDYIPLRIQTLNGDLTVNSDYGSITVETISGQGGDITISSDYAGIKLGYDSDYSFDFDIELSYAGLSGKDDLEMQHSHSSNNKKSYKGHHGTKGSGNTITINSSYGGVSLKKN